MSTKSTVSTYFLNYTWRTFAAALAFTVAAVLFLRPGQVGPNSAIFSVASALLLRPLPFQDADRIAILSGTGLPRSRPVHRGLVLDRAVPRHPGRRWRGFEQVALAIGANFNLTGDGPPEGVGTIRVSSNLLPMLGVTPAMGRLFTPEEDAQAPSTTAILSHGTWVRRYGSDPSVIGRSIVLNGQAAKVVGVLGPSFSLRKETMPTLGVVADAEILLPLPLDNVADECRGTRVNESLAQSSWRFSIERA